ncbi:MAG: hypothetical protein ABI950_06390 [Solirubrobacteraceae bacterium]
MDVTPNRPALPRGTTWEEDATPGAAHVVALVRRWRVALVVAAVTAGLVGYVSVVSGTPTYETNAVLLVGPTNTDSDTLQAAGQVAQTYAQLATSGPLIAATEHRLGLAAITSEISASASDVTRLLSIRVTDRDPARGARIANAHAVELVALADRALADQSKSRVSRPGELRIVDPAQPARSASGPDAASIALVAGLGGLLCALGLALLTDRFGDSLRGSHDVPVLTGAGTVARLSGGAWQAAGRQPLVASAPDSRAAEEYRLLGAKLQAIGERSLLLLQVDDRAPGVMPNLAAAMAQRGLRVVLLEIARDRVTELGPDAPPAVAEVALADLVEADDARRLLDEHAAADVILIDAPSLSRSSSALVWASVADAAMMAGQVDRTRRGDLARAADSLRLVHARVLGTIVGAPPGLLHRPGGARQHSAPGRAVRRPGTHA